MPRVVSRSSLLMFFLFSMLIFSAALIAQNGGDEDSDALVRAAAQGNFEIAKSLVEQGVDIDKGGPLIQAIYRGHWEIVELLLENGADINKGAAITGTNNYYSPLEAAITENSYKIFEIMFDQPRQPITDVNARNRNGYTALIRTVNSYRYGLWSRDLFDESRNSKLLEKLISAGIDVNAGTNNGYTALHLAAMGGIDSVIRILIDAGADVGIRDESYGKTAEEWAQEGRHNETAQLIATYNKSASGDLFEGRSEGRTEGHSQYNQEDMLRSIEKGDIDMVKTILEYGLNIDIDESFGYAIAMQEFPAAALLQSNGGRINRKYANSTDITGASTILMVIVGSPAVDQLADRLDLVKQCIAGGADVNKRDGWDTQWTALMIAAKSGRLSIARVLLSAGADINAVGSYGKTALTLAADAGQGEMVRLLLDYGADTGELLAAASAGGNIDTVKSLVAAGVDVNKGAPVVQAAFRGYWEIVEFLMKNGADLNVSADIVGINVHYSPMEAAIAENSFKVYEVLVADPAVRINDIGATDAFGFNAVMKFVTAWTRYGADDVEKLAVVKKLIQAGVDINTLSDNGDTALMYAARYLPTSAVSALLDAGADPDVRSSYGKTAIELAVERKRLENVQALIEGGASAYADQKENLTHQQASSTLPDSKIANRYSIEKAYDEDPLTSWVEGKDDAGIGEYIEFSFGREVTIDAVRAMPGYFDERYWHRNNRIQTMLIKGGSRDVRLEFDDEMKAQTVLFEPIKARTLRIEIAEIYKGESWDDTCLAEIAFFIEGKKITW